VKSFAKQLRCQATDAEQLLWKHLRARRLAGFKFRRQLAVEPYIVDFACFEAKLVVEADGSQHGEKRDCDDRRTEFLQARGWRVLRFWNHEILMETQTVLEQIHRELLLKSPN
jgi:very-short-patch-repair endonuclease